MNGANQRAALAELAAARPSVLRLAAQRDPEENAADLIEAWSAVETALRSLVGGSVLSGEPLVREVRQRNLLSLGQAHALLGFLAVRDRVQRTEYRPTADDLGAARTGFQQLEEALAGGAEPAATGAAPSGAPDAAAPARVTVGAAPRRTPWGWIVLSLLLLAGVGGAAYVFATRSRPSEALVRGEELYRRGDRSGAREAFARAARENPELALPHIFLGRIAREEGEMATAGRELARALQLERDNALGHRELGSLFLATGQFDAARRSYVRALELEPGDRLARGYLGCALVRLGRVQEGLSWIDRAGSGDWQSCAPRPGAPAGAPPPS